MAASNVCQPTMHLIGRKISAMSAALQRLGEDEHSNSKLDLQFEITMSSNLFHERVNVASKGLDVAMIMTGTIYWNLPLPSKFYSTYCHGEL